MCEVIVCYVWVCEVIVCVKFVCVKLLYVTFGYVKLLYVTFGYVEAAGGRRRRRRRSPGYRIKNKNPTQRCGEKDGGWAKMMRRVKMIENGGDRACTWIDVGIYCMRGFNFKGPLSF